MRGAGLRHSGGMTIFHIARVPDWTAVLETGEYRVSTVGLSVDSVGYVHASTQEQVGPTARRFYRDEDAALCVLVIDDDRVRAAGTEVLEEDGGDGQNYPHIYGPVRPDWVSEVRPASFGQDGRFIW